LSCSPNFLAVTPNAHKNRHEKRRYRRHPKPDIHSPKRPLSAYAIFANEVRKNISDKQLSFTQLARHVGKSWQLLSDEELNERKMLAATARISYLQDFEKYQQTKEYREYQMYLEGFKVKLHNAHQRPNRRSTSHHLSAMTGNIQMRIVHDNVLTSE
jgi:hypothetical protein